MDKEVELILSKLKIVSEEQERGLYLCDKEHSKLLLDYITNLQQENEELIDKLDIFILSNKTKQETIDNFRKRIEKAVEYMKKHIEKCNIDGYEGKFDNFDIFTKPQELLNILNGRSDE